MVPKSFPYFGHLIMQSLKLWVEAVDETIIDNSWYQTS